MRHVFTAHCFASLRSTLICLAFTRIIQPLKSHQTNLNSSGEPLTLLEEDAHIFYAHRPQSPRSQLVKDDAATLPLRFMTNSTQSKDPVRLLYSPPVQANLKVLVLVKGAIQHVKQRRQLRKRYQAVGSRSGDHIRYDTSPRLGVRFIVGKALHDDRMNEEVLQEVYTHNDVIIGDFEDSYANLVLKSLAALLWYTRIAPADRPQYVLLIDDDVEVNLEELNKVLESDADPQDSSSNPFLLCPWKNPKHARVTRRGPWAVPLEKYSETHWPSYCGGACYLVNFHAAEQLYQASQNVVAVDVQVEDAFITGVLRKRAKMGIHSTKPVCVHHYARDSVTGQFLENHRGNERKDAPGGNRTV